MQHACTISLYKEYAVYRAGHVQRHVMNTKRQHKSRDVFLGTRSLVVTSLGHGGVELQRSAGPATYDDLVAQQSLAGYPDVAKMTRT